MRYIAVLSGTLAALASFVTVCAAKPTEGPPTLDSSGQLLLDDVIIARLFHCERVFHQPARFVGNPLIRADHPWEGTTVTFGSTLYDPKTHLFQMWYLAHDIWGSRNGRRPIADSAFICYARSTDGVNWEKPSLGLVEYQGSNDNNIVLRHQGSHFDSFSVIKAPWETDPERTFRLVAFQGTWPYDEDQIRAMGFSYKWPPAHFPFYSRDGIHWTPDYGHPVFTADLAFDRSCFGMDLKRHKYLAFLKWDHENKRVRRQSESDDFVHWTEPQFLCIPDAQDLPDMEFYGDYRFDYGNMYLGLLEQYRTGPDTIELELLHSRDNVKWERTHRAFIPLGTEGSWDSELVMLQSSAPCEVGDELWFFYGGYGTKHETVEQHGMIGLARLRRDGFASIDAGAEEGRLTTVPVTLKGEQLRLNANAEGGEIRVELREENGSPIAGFSRADCQPIAADGVRLEVSWTKGPKLPTDRAVRVVLYLRNARVYSMAAV